MWMERWRGREQYVLTNPSVCSGPFAILRCVRGRSEAKHSPRKNTMRHFCNENQSRTVSFPSSLY